MNEGPRSPYVPTVPGLSGFAVLARGGYATVYRATQESVGRDVAVKVENRALDSDRDQRRFLREARAAGRMSSHPHVVDLFDAGVTSDQQPYLVMELCDGSYADRMRTAPLTAVEARDLGVKIADALAHSHHNGVLHRDVKPANILHSRFNSAVLADFGLAVLAEVRDSSVTLEVLTPAYAPPEMFRHSAPSPAVDVYALCATLYAVMSGKPPRWREDRNPSLITLMEMFAEPIPDLPGAPRDLLDVLRAGMANDPASRPYAEQLRDLLAAVQLPAAGPNAPTSGGPPLISPLSPVPGTPAFGSGSYGSGFGPGPYGSGPGHGTGAYGGNSGPGPYGGAGRAPDGAPADNNPTVQTRRRRFGWLFGGFGALALLAAAGTLAWAVAGGPAPAPSPSATVPGAPQPASAQPSAALNRGPGGAALPGCLVRVAGGGRCPDSLECYGALPVVGGAASARPVDCARRHTWEVFAIGSLPAGTRADDLARLRANALVRRVCNESTFRAFSRRMDTGWRIEVLPPTPAALRAGDRDFRCLAGKGKDQLTGPTLAR